MNRAFRRHRVSPRTRYQRPVVTDVLPFEVPPSFSNGGFFHFLTKYNVRIDMRGDEAWLRWEANGSIADTAISILFNVGQQTTGNFATAIERHDGKNLSIRRWKIDGTWTLPFNFKISHKVSEFRQLSIVHPQNQLLVADFYDRYSSLIIYECSKSGFSIRRPASVAKTIRFKDRLFRERNAGSSTQIEEANKEYENIGSYFVYEAYSNIFKFYENYSYLNAEKKFCRLLKLDISGCFDSIYTHSLPWSVLGQEAAKQNLKLKGTFGHRFDALMQHMNRGETNGIVIGPEFSRIFAEIILQAVDQKLEKALRREHNLRNKVDYEIFRYVDDYFIFSSEPSIEILIKGHLAAFLKEVKLSLSAEKSESIERPIITPLTIAKNKISDIFTSRVVIVESDREDPKDASATVKHFAMSAQAKALMVDFKAAIKESNVQYKDVLNYTLAAVERRVESFFKHFDKNNPAYRKEQDVVKAIVGLLEFAFFVYAASPRVNFSVRLARIISNVVDEVHSRHFGFDLKSHLFKFVFDNLFRQIRNTPHDRFHEVETLYLILAVDKLGRAYTLPQDVLAKFLGIEVSSDGTLSKTRRMTYFSISVCLLYIRNRKRYTVLKSFIEDEIRRKFRERSSYLRSDAELVIGFLDLQTCPYVSDHLKNYLAGLYKLSCFETPFLRLVTPHWFTDWQNFSLSLELDKKRSREVY